MSLFVDLPIEVQLEVFGFLSLKHLGNVLSLNKATHEQVMKSERFWKSLLNNYSKSVPTHDSIGENDHQEMTFDVEMIRMTLIKLVNIKRSEIESLQRELKISNLERREIESLELVMKEINSDSRTNLKLDMKLKYLQKEIEFLMEKINSKLID